MQIPIKLEVIPKSIALSHPIYLPMIFSGIPNPPGSFSNHILYSSQWFTDHQLATIEYTGQFRTPLVHNLPAIDAMVFSPDGNKVAIRMVGADNRRKIEIRNIKSGEIVGQIEGQLEGGGNYTPSWSPDNSRVAFVSYGDELNSDLYVANADGGGVRRLTDGTLLQDLAYWSPANEKIAFGTSTPSYGYVNSTAIINPDGTDLQILDFSIKHFLDIPVGWSPDGKILLIYAQDYTIGSMGLWSYDIQTGEYKMLVDGNNYAGSASWSPDGAHIAFRSCRNIYDCWVNR